jgi:hypothetical protein
MKTNSQEYYIVSAKCYEVKSYDGKVLTKDNETVWLAEGDWGVQCERGKGWAKKFKTPPTKSEIKSWDGMPWYYRLKPNSEKVYKVKSSVTTTYEEALV